MTGPRSAVLGKYLLQAAGTFNVAQAPPATTLIVKQIVVWVQAATVQHVIVYIVSGSGNGVTAILSQGDSDTATSLVVSTYTVLGVGDAIYVQTPSATTHVWVSGTVLQGVANYQQPAVPTVLPAFPPGGLPA